MPRRNPTTPLPDRLPPTEPALLTKREFLGLRNPGEKFHETGAYESSIADLDVMGAHVIGATHPFSPRERKLWVYAMSREATDLIFRDAETSAVTAVLRDGTLYRSRGRQVPRWYYLSGEPDSSMEIAPRAEKEVKYPEEYARLIEDVVGRNRAKYPLVLQRVLIDGERFEIRAEREPRPNKLDTIVFMNRDGHIVARGDNEWGATLLRVAKEYRGRGIGRALAVLWYELNPASESGGFTLSGERNAIAAWEARVRDFLSRGWYSALVQRGDLTTTRVREIMSGLSVSRERSPLPEYVPEVEPDLRVYLQDGEIAFVLYDARFLDDRDEKYVYGYGFLRDTDEHGSFFYRIEHDHEYADLATAIGLQMARDLGEQIYVADIPGDVVEWQRIPAAKEEDGYVFLTKDILPLKKLAAQERRARKKVDTYGEVEQALLEIADSKWR